MYARKQQRQKYHRLVSWLLPGLLTLVLLAGCGGTANGPTGTPTPRVTASPTMVPTPSVTVKPGPTPSPTATSGPTATPTQEPAPTPTKTPPPTATPTPTRTPSPTPRPTPSPCDTPPGVQPVSPIEIGIGNTGKPQIALTFDAGGPAEPTSRILDILAKHGVHVTFFITGDWANQNPALVRRIYNEGHEIGNHTMHHPDLRTLTDQQICGELNQAEQVISNLTGVSTRPYFRPPYGGRDNRVRSLAAQLGYRTVYWTVDTLDWQTTATSDSITNIVMSHLNNGSIVLMHAGSQVESETLDALMTKIEQKGFQIVSVSQVLR